MPCVFRKQRSAFREFSYGIVGSLVIGQKETQDVLRNKWGKKLDGAIGINPILSKNEIFGHLNDTRQELLKQIDLEFNEFGEVVVGHVDIQKNIYVFLLGVWLGCLVLIPSGLIRPLYTTPREYHTTWRRPVYSRLPFPYCYIVVYIVCDFYLYSLACNLYSVCPGSDFCK